MRLTQARRFFGRSIFRPYLELGDISIINYPLASYEITKPLAGELLKLCRDRCEVEEMNINHDKAPPVEVTEGNFEVEVLRPRQPVLVVFWAPWSRPCQILDSVLKEVVTASAGSLRVVRVNADDNPDLSMWYEVQSIPTLLFFTDGTPHARMVGTASREAILAKLQMLLQGGDAKSQPKRSPI
jgi:thioredoxin 1